MLQNPLPLAADPAGAAAAAAGAGEPEPVVLRTARTSSASSSTMMSVTEAPSEEPSPAPPGRGTVPEAIVPADELVIQPSRGWIGINWGELYRYRELLAFLIWRDIKVRYKQAVLGVAWAVLQPVVSMIVFTLVFGIAANLKEGLPKSVPYAVLVFSGLLPWQLFALAVGTGGMSLVSQQNLLTKIYFPRLFVPTAVVGGAVVDTGIAFCAFLVLVAFKGGVVLSPLLLCVPLLLGLTVMLSLGMAYLMSALTISFRDFRFILPFMVQIWMWGSFVAFPVPKKIVENPGHWQWAFALNPMHGIISTFRRVLFGENFGYSPLYLATSILISASIFVLGLFYFRRTERRFADIA
jgi:lipopolysaccharide transport system permease protein